MEKGIQKLGEIKEADRAKKLQRDTLAKEKLLKEFTPGKGYKHLLEFAKDGILDYSDVEKRIVRYNSEIRDREITIKKGMLNKLIAAGYLEPLHCEAITPDNRRPHFETGLFRLTKKAVDFIDCLKLNDQAQEPVPKTKLMEKQATIKITKFDLDNIVQLSKDGVFTKEMLAASPRRATIEKRITTLAAAGLLVICDVTLLKFLKKRCTLKLTFKLILSRTCGKKCEVSTFERRSTMEIIKLDAAYKSIVNELKQKIRVSQQKAILSANKELISLYWNIGSTILDMQKKEGWGAKIIESLSRDLTSAFPELKGFSTRNLKYMRKFAESYPNFQFVQEALAQIPWYHNLTLVEKVSDLNERIWYINQTIENGWSRNVLVHHIESALYRRQVIESKTTNFSKTLPPLQSDFAQQVLKDPYIFDFLNIGREHMKEKSKKNLSNISRNFY